MIRQALRLLFPNGAPWRLAPGSMIRRFVDGLGDAAEDARDYIDRNWRDVVPETTERLADFEEQFGVEARGLSESERRARLRALWSALGGQSPRYLQDTLRGAGFDVYVHEWWRGQALWTMPGREEGYEPTVLQFSDGTDATLGGVTPRNPALWLGNGLDIQVACGEPLAACGEPTALCGNTASGEGYAIQNRRLLGEPAPVPSVPPAQWPFFWYVGGETFGDQAQVPAERREEFERLLLQIGPAHQWIGVLVDYV